MATVTASSSSSTHLLHHLFRHPKRPSSVCVFFKPAYVSTFTHKPSRRLEPRFISFLVSRNSSLPPFSSSISLSPPLSSLFVAESYSSVHEPEHEEDEDEDEDTSLSAVSEEDSNPNLLLSLETSESEVANESSGKDLEKKESITAKPRNLSLKLSIKEKKELSSYAHSLGKKLKSQLVGKSGVTDSLVSSFVETLEKNELLKVKIHRTCPGEIEEVVQHLEEATGSIVVSQIGRTVIVYRPSLTKLKVEQKKKEAARVSIRRAAKFSPASSKEYAMKTSGRGRRGGSRVEEA